MATIKIQRYCFSFMVFMVSLFNYSENTLLKLITNISVLMFVAVVILSSFGKVRISQAHKYFVIFFVICIISIPFSTATNDSINKIKTLTLLAFELMAVYHYATNDEELDHALTVIALCSTITAIYIVAQGFTLLQTVRRVGHITGDSNQVSAYLVYGILVLTFLFFKKKAFRLVLVIGIVTSLLAIILQGSRTAILVAGTTFVLEVFLLMRYERTSFSKRLIVFVLVLVLIIVAAYYIMTNPTLYMTLGRRIFSFYQIQTAGSSDINELSTFNRMTAYRLAFERFMENPIIGRGIGSFASFSGQSVLRRYGFCPNNYLELLQGVGLLGTLFYYLFYQFIMKNSISAYKNRSNDLSVLATSVMIAMLLEHITVVFYYQKLEYLFLGVLLAICYNTRRSEFNEKNHRNLDFSSV